MSRGDAMTRAPRIRRQSGQTLAEYAILVLFVMIGLLLVLPEFEDVLRRMYINAVSLIYCTFP